MPAPKALSGSCSIFIRAIRWRPTRNIGSVKSYYVRGQYKQAADAFLNGYKKYKTGQKAPDTLLKLAMSLVELGQTDAACSTLSELKAAFPQAPPHVGEEAASWRKKTGC